MKGCQRTRCTQTMRPAFLPPRQESRENYFHNGLEIEMKSGHGCCSLSLFHSTLACHINYVQASYIYTVDLFANFHYGMGSLGDKSAAGPNNTGVKVRRSTPYHYAGASQLGLLISLPDEHMRGERWSLYKCKCGNIGSRDVFPLEKWRFNRTSLWFLFPSPLSL